MKTYFLSAALAMALCACASSPNEVIEKVKYDFGLGEKPAGYVSPTDQVKGRLDGVGRTELKRLNVAGRHGEVLFQDEGGMRGKYYKQVKQYESYHPLDASAITHGAGGDRGYVGYIEYTYRMYQSERKSNRAEAAAAPANVDAQVSGREVYRYSFSNAGIWDGAEGELTNQ